MKELTSSKVNPDCLVNMPPSRKLTYFKASFKMLTVLEPRISPFTAESLIFYSFFVFSHVPHPDFFVVVYLMESYK